LNVAKWSCILICTQVLLPGCRPKMAPLGVSGEIVELKIKDRVLKLEVACDVLSQRAGLMNRKTLGKDSGMLFIYPEPGRLGFYMKDTYIPLSIAFVDDSGKILQIEDMQPKDESSTVSNYEVRYAVEVHQGWFQRGGIGVGDVFSDLPAKAQAFHVSR